MWMTVGKALRQADELLEGASTDLLTEIKDFLHSF
jgi:hypothetical protein